MSLIYTTPQCEIQAVVCDRCKAEIRDPMDLAEVLHVRLIGGYTSQWGDGTRVAVDLCDACAHTLLSPFATLSPSDECLAGKPALGLGSTHRIPLRSSVTEQKATETLESAPAWTDSEGNPLSDEDIERLESFWKGDCLHPIDAAWRRARERIRASGSLDKPMLRASRSPEAPRLMRDFGTWKLVEGPSDRFLSIFRYAFSRRRPFPITLSDDYADALVWEYIDALTRRGQMYQGEGLDEWERKVHGRA
jgi:hypothetical protein